MSSERLETVRRWTDAFNRRDLDALVGSLDPEFELHEWPAAPGAETHHGPEGALRAIDKWFEAWEWMQVEIEDLREVGDNVLVQLYQRAKGKGSEVEVDIRSFNVYTFRGAGIARIQLFTEEEPALEAAGLSGTIDVEAMLRSGYDAFTRGDYQAFAEILDPDVRWEHNLGSGAPEEGVYNGRDEVLRLFERLGDAWEQQSYEVQEVVQVGPGEYRVRGVVHATGKASSLSLDAGCEYAIEVLDGKAVRVGFSITGPGSAARTSNVGVILAVNDAVAAGDVQAVRDRLDEDIVWEHNIGGGSPEEGVYRGRENVIALFQRILEPWEGVRLGAQEVSELSDGVVQVEGELHFKHPDSAVEVNEPYMQIVEVRDEVLVRGEMKFGALVRERGEN